MVLENIQENDESNEPFYTTFEIYGGDFNGYRTTIDINEKSSFDEIEKIIIKCLQKYLEEVGLKDLREKTDKITLISYSKWSDFYKNKKYMIVYSSFKRRKIIYPESFC